MRGSIFLLSCAALLVPSVAVAQFGKPTIQAVAVPDTVRLLSIEEIDDDARIELSWTAAPPSFLESYEYELTYDQTRTTESPNAELVVLDDDEFAGDPEGPVVPSVQARIYIRPSQIVRSADLPENGLGVNEGKRGIYLRVFRASSPLDVNTSESFVWNFEYDTRVPPAPTLYNLIAGENRLQVQWTAPDPATDVEFYEVAYCPDVRDLVVPDAGVSDAGDSKDAGVTDGGSNTGGVLPCDRPVTKGNITKTQNTLSIKDGLQNGVLAAVAVRSVDKFGNKGLLSPYALQTPSEVTDFFELYRREGGTEDGGFCFVATAAHGSYAHPVVQVLRWFRDGVLARTPLGAAAVRTYYRLSPPLADEIAGQPTLAAWTRAALLPVAAVALVWLGLPILGIFALGSIAVRRARRRRSAAAAVGAILVLAAVGHAEASPRPKSSLHTVGLGFEFRGGPYLPAQGNEGGAPDGTDAFGRIYGTSPNPLYTLGIEAQLYRGIGTAGVAGSFGFMQFVGKSLFGDTDASSSDTTVFNLLPLTLEAVYRFDWLAENTPIPFVPYVKGGLAYYVWWATTGTGDVSRVEDPTDPQADLAARGGKLGLTGSVGLSLLLNFFDDRSTHSLFDSTGIRGTYLFGELRGARVDGFGAGGFDLSDLTWNLGIMFEM